MKLGNTEIEISPIILGTWQAGKNMWVGINDSDSIKTIRASIDAGVSTIDTAAIYGDGHSETIIGKAIDGIPREKIQILTKVFPTDLAYQAVITSCENSLRRLKTDHVELLQIHWPSGTYGSAVVPIEETLKAFVRLQNEGKIRAIGVSNFSEEQIAEAQRYAPIASNQPPYSLFWPQSEQYAIRYSQQENISSLAYSALAQGLLTGKFGADHQFEKADNRSTNVLVRPEHFAHVQTAITQLTDYARAKNISLPHLALAWVTSQDNCAAIAGARNQEQALANAAALTVTFNKSEILELNEIAKTVTEHLDANPVQWR